MKNTANTIIEDDKHLILLSHKLGNKALALATLILVVVNLFYSLPYAPFIILLMSSRIVSSVYLLIKKPTKKEIIWLVVWVTLMAKSLQSYIVYLLSI